MKSAAFFVIVVILTVSSSLSDDAAPPLPTTIRIDGDFYEGVTWSTVTPTTVKIFHKTGVATIPLDKLPVELQRRFNYDSKKIAELRAAEESEKKRRAEMVAKEATKHDKARHDTEEEAKAGGALKEPAQGVYRRMAAYKTAGLDLDFINGTFKGKSLFEMDVDSVTDLLGRPESTGNEPNHWWVSYKSSGLKFSYSKDKNQTYQLLTLDVYFDSIEDSLTKEYFSPFKGKLNDGVSSNWKVSRFITTFKDFGAVEKTDARLLKLLPDPNKLYKAEIPVGIGVCLVWVYYDPASLFINRMVIICGVARK